VVTIYFNLRNGFDVRTDPKGLYLFPFQRQLDALFFTGFSGLFKNRQKGMLPGRGNKSAETRMPVSGG
jgi:hypothetical protein